MFTSYKQSMIILILPLHIFVYILVGYERLFVWWIYKQKSTGLNTTATFTLFLRCPAL